MNLTDIIVGIAGILGSSLVAYLAYKRGTKADDAANEEKAIARVYEGYGGLLKRIEDDNKDLRLQVIELRKRLYEAEERIYLLLEKLESK